MSGRGAYYKALYGGGRSKRRQNDDSFGGGSRQAFTEETGNYASSGPPSRPRTGASSLRSELQRLEGKPYPAYKDLMGEWQLEEFQLFIDKLPELARSLVPIPLAGTERQRARRSVADPCGCAVRSSRKHQNQENFFLAQAGPRVHGTGSESPRNGLL